MVYGGVKVEFQLFLTSALGDESGQLHATAALPLEREHAGSTEQESGWASNPVWTIWRRENPLALTGNRTTVPRLSSFVA